MELKDYYEILEVHRKASFEVIQKAYKVLALKYHPDRNSNNLYYAEEKMKTINEAYEVLNNPVKRENYNKIYDNQFNNRSSNHNTTKDNSSNVYSKTGTSQHSSERENKQNNNSTINQKNEAKSDVSYIVLMSIAIFGVFILIFSLIIAISSKSNIDYSSNIPINNDTSSTNVNSTMNSQSTNSNNNPLKITPSNNNQTSNPNQTTEFSNYITIGSTEQEVNKIMGTPTGISYNTWSYGYSTIEFSAYGEVTGWNEIDKKLKVTMGNKIQDAPPLTIGSTEQEVINAMGTPTGISYNTWSYGYSTIEFSAYSKVTGWNEIDKKLKVR